MRISGVTIIKNGVKLGYPFIQSIQSLLLICDEVIAVVGDCEDDTSAKIEELGSDKIKIINTVWDPAMRKGGAVLAQQTNIGLDAATGDWIFYLQADEIIHEKDAPALKREMEVSLNDPKIEGLLFPYYHFWTYDYVTVTRRAYRREIRVVRNLKGVRSYRDAQGFRIYSSPEAQQQGEKGRKLKVKLIKPHIYAYGRVRPPKEEHAKILEFVKLWQSDEEVEARFKGKEAFEYERIDKVVPFPQDQHPALMMPRVRANTFHIKPIQGHFKFKHRILYGIERLTGHRLGEYRNYTIVSRSK